VRRTAGAREPKDIAAEIARHCVANRLRSLTRAVTSIYDDAFRPFGGKISQLNVLAALCCLEQATPTQLGRMLHLDKSTLTRNLERMRARDWIESGPGEDGRSRRLRLTREGRQLLTDLYPAWQRAQRKARGLLGQESAVALERMATMLRSASGGRR
jgi:DNA-binding MarR family transcriptional regulator